MKRSFIVILLAVIGIFILGSCADISLELFDYNIDFIVDGEVYSSVGTNGDTISMPKDPKKDNYTFVGWFWESDNQSDGEDVSYGEEFTLLSILDRPIKENNNYRVYAKFLGDSYTVTYNDGENEKTDDVELGSHYQIDKPYKKNKVFLGWYDENDVQYTDDNGKSLKKYDLTKDLNLFAKWEEVIIYTVTFVKNDGTDDVITKEVEKSFGYVYFPNIKRDRYEFLGFYKDKELTQEWDEYQDKVEQDITLYAKWLGDFVTITYRDQDYNYTSKEVRCGEKLQAKTLDNLNYNEMLDGWYTDYDFTNKWDFNNTVECDMYLYAKVVNKPYKITLQGDLPEGAITTVETRADCWFTLPTYVGDLSVVVSWQTSDGTVLKSGKEYLYNYDKDIVLTAIVTSVISYELLEDDTYGVKIGLNGYPLNADTFEIPSTYLGKSVTKILRGYTTSNIIRKLIIPDSIIEIDSSAFICLSSLESVSFGSGLKKIGESAFEFCQKLNSLIIPSNVESVGRCAFSNCTGLTDLTIEEGVKSLGIGAFAGCSSLRLACVPKSVTSVGANAFNETSDIVVFYAGENIPEGWSSINQYGCAIYTDAKKDDVVKVNNTFFLFRDSGATLIKYVDDSMSYYNVPSAVTHNGKDYNVVGIGAYSFYNKNVSGINLPNTIVEIGDRAFYCCRDLQTINIPQGVKIIGEEAFFYTDLYKIALPISLDSVIGSLFDDGNTIILYEGSEDLKNTNTWLREQGVIYYNATADDVVISGGNTYIISGQEATLRQYVNDQENAVIPDTIMHNGESLRVTKIASKALYQLHNIVNLTLPKYLEYVGSDFAFGCYNIKYYEEDGLNYLGSADNKYLMLASHKPKYTNELLTIKKEVVIVKNDFCNYDSVIGGLEFEEDSKLTCIGEDAFSISISQKTPLYLPLGIKYIGVDAFNYNMNIIIAQEETKPLGWSDCFTFNGVVHYGYKTTIRSLNQNLYKLNDDMTASLVYADQDCKQLFVPSTVVFDENTYTVVGIENKALIKFKSSLLYLPSSIERFNNESSDFYGLVLMQSLEFPEDFTYEYHDYLLGIDENMIVKKDNVWFVVVDNYAIAVNFDSDEKSYLVPKSITIDTQTYEVNRLHKAFIASLTCNNLIIPNTITIIDGKYYDLDGIKVYLEHNEQQPGFEKYWSTFADEIYYGVGSVEDKIKNFTFITKGTAVDAVSDYGVYESPQTSLQDNYFWDWYDNAEFTNQPISFPYFGTATTLYARFETERKQDGKTFDTAYELKLNEVLNVEITQPSQVVYFVFNNNRILRDTVFKSRGSMYTSGSIYNEYKNNINIQNTGLNNNFEIKNRMSSKKYYFSARLEASNETGLFQVILVD